MPIQDIPRSRFGAISAVTRTGDGRFEGELHGGWTIGGKPNGGYLLAILGRAVTDGATQHAVLAASAHYLRAPSPGPVRISTEVLREGRAASQLRASLLQGDQLCVEALFTVGVLDPTAAPYWAAGLPQPGPGAFETALRLPPRTPTGMEVAIFGEVDVRLDPESLQWATGRPRGAGELRGWLQLPAGEDFDPVSLLYAVDAFPPATLDIELTGWVPTLELTAYVRAVPAPGPVRILQSAQLIDDSKVDEACFVWDSTGRLVAQATQLAGIRLGS